MQLLVTPELPGEDRKKKLGRSVSEMLYTAY